MLEKFGICNALILNLIKDKTWWLVGLTHFENTLQNDSIIKYMSLRKQKIIKSKILPILETKSKNNGGNEEETLKIDK